MKHTRVLRTSALLAIAALALSGCAGSAPAAKESSDAANGEAGFPRTIEHFRGTTEIPEQPTRVAALDTSYVDGALLLGAEVVAYPEYRLRDQGFPAYLGDVSELTDEAVSVGTLQEPDLEKLLATEPDLIISADLRQGPLFDQFQKIAPTVFSEVVGATWKENIVLLGEALGKETQAKQAVADYEQRAAAVGKEILAKDDETTYTLVRFMGEDTARLYSSESFIGEVMADMGIPRPAEAPDTDQTVFTQLSPEEILTADATVIFQATSAPEGSEGDAARAQADSFTANPLWTRLEGDVMEVSDEIFLTSVSIQGANEVITQVAEHFKVDPHLP
ncbi:iron-siderophore ABC transporter substrate-binding protein [Glutamicibacter sp.]|uniref:ABC transporter substrate-binding protein n=1 Tax=Glutamicibacter sp. TaxID=1931995 RepID=UPI0028BF51D5|nr:iron-siderophore ABC transporter substrate-binding protein [Glutamicibacter sp.]